MTTNNPNTPDPQLTSLLREARVSPPLPPRFQDNVWRRIADAEVDKSSDAPNVIDALIAWILRPRLAIAALAVLVISGALFGMREGSQLARQDAQTRYLASVAPNTLR